MFSFVLRWSALNVLLRVAAELQSVRLAPENERALAPRADLFAQDILNKGIEALGGRTKLEALKGVSSHAYIYRTNTLMESTTPGFPDTLIAVAGTQNISYDLSGPADEVVQRIDRQYAIGEFLLFGRPQLKGNNVSIVTRGGEDGYSCYVNGNELIFLPPGVPLGYTDPAYANVLLRDATRLSPKLLLNLRVAPQAPATTLVVRDVSYPAITDPGLNITVAFRPDTFLPYLIRSYENHNIYGRSSNDYMVYNYTTVAGVKFPRRIKVVYNEDNLLVDTLIGDVKVNPTFPRGFFIGLPESQINQTAFKSPPVPAEPSKQYDEAEVYENSQTLFWAGGYLGKLDNISVTNPVEGLPGLIHLRFNDAPVYTTTVADTGDAVLVTDAPPHQSQLVIQWVRENLRKEVTHLLLSHHHHDHAYGVADFVAAGAAIVVPDNFKYYYDRIPGIRFAPVNYTHPFIHRSESMQVRAVWPGSKTVHSADWMYFTFTPACPTATSPFAVLVADAWNPGVVGYQFEHEAATAYLSIAREARIPRKNLIIPIHGVPSNASELYALTAYDYPDYGNLDFLPGGPWC